MTDHPHLHRDDLPLFAGFLSDGLFAAATFAGQFMLGQFVEDVQARQTGQRHNLFSFVGSSGLCSDFEANSFWRAKATCP